MATCKDCLHYEACKAVLDLAGFFSDDIEEMLNAIKCPNFADKSRFVELPCKVGDKVWYLNAINEICEAVVTCVKFNIYTKPQIWISIKYYSELCGEHTHTSRIDMALNKTVFLTREEVEAALAERRNE